MLTKFLDRGSILKHLHALNMSIDSGRSSGVPIRAGTQTIDRPADFDHDDPPPLPPPTDSQAGQITSCRLQNDFGSNHMQGNNDNARIDSHLGSVISLADRLTPVGGCERSSPFSSSFYTSSMSPALLWADMISDR